MAAAAAPAALAASSAMTEAMKAGDHLVAQILAWANKPFFTDSKTVTRSWVEIDKHGRAQHLTETKTKGFSVSNGLVFGAFLLVCLWEIGLALAKGLDSGIKDAAEVLAAPVIIAMDVTEQVVGVGVAIFNDAQQAWSYIWDHHDGSGPAHPAPPPTAVKTVSVPATGMAGMSQSLANGLMPFVTGSGILGQKVSNFIANPPSINPDFSTKSPTHMGYTSPDASSRSAGQRFGISTILSTGEAVEHDLATAGKAIEAGAAKVGEAVSSGASKVASAFKKDLHL